MTKNYVLKPIYNDENECINDTLSGDHFVSASDRVLELLQPSDALIHLLHMFSRSRKAERWRRPPLLLARGCSHHHLLSLPPSLHFFAVMTRIKW